MPFRTSIGRVRGLGSAREGVSHWKLQRLTAISNLLLVLWFVFSAMALSGGGYAEYRAWLSSPVVASLMILLIVSVFYHARLGVQVVIEDYVHHEGAKVGLLAAVTLALFALAVACIVAVLKIALGD
ncbi:MAG: succinate dehydrogenase, hydrophobic membrane anchor protein [Geminicoccaceae bacterium]